MYKHKMKASKISFLRERAEGVEDALKEQEGSIALEAARSFLATLDRWEEQDGIIPAEITKACITMEGVCNKAPEVSSMVGGIISALEVEEQEANEKATPDNFPVGGLNQKDYGVIFTTYKPKEVLA